MEMKNTSFIILVILATVVTATPKKGEGEEGECKKGFVSRTLGRVSDIFSAPSKSTGSTSNNKNLRTATAVKRNLVEQAIVGLGSVVGIQQGNRDFKAPNQSINTNTGGDIGEHSEKPTDHLQNGYKSDELSDDVLQKNEENVGGANGESIGENRKKITDNLQDVNNNELKEAAVIANSTVEPNWAQAKVDFQKRFNSEQLPEIMQSKFEYFDVIDEIGRGTFGVVYKVEKMSDKKEYAMKVIKKIGVDMNAVKKEKMLLYAMDCEHISKLRYYFEEKTEIFLVMDYVTGVHFLRHLQTDGRLSEEEARYSTTGVVYALEYLHNVGCIHHDINLNNIIIDSKRNCKLIDFGLSKVTYGNAVKEYDKAYGTPLYMAPELVSFKPYSHLIDCWSFGVVLYFMVLGKYPFDGQNTREVIVSIKSCELKFPDDVVVSDEFKDLITNLLTDDVEKRYDIHKIKAHAWFMQCFNGSEQSSQTANEPIYSQ